MRHTPDHVFFWWQKSADHRQNFLDEIQDLHKKFVGTTLELDERGDMSYLCKRVRLIWYLTILLARERISIDRYIELSSLINADIMESPELVNNYDATDERWVSLSELMDW